jgi:DNA-binding NarL/FixJ family response regulator
VRDSGAVSFSCVIVDDNPNVLDAARALLGREGAQVLGTASTIAEGLQLVADVQPDVTLVDIDLGGESGFDLVARLAPARTILISTHTERDFADLIEASAALGFLSKSALSAAAIEAILSGRRGT